MLKHGQAVAQHPVGQGLHELGGLVGVKTGHKHGLGQLAHVCDEFAVFGGLANFNFVKAHVHLTCKTMGLSLEGTNVIVHAEGEGSCRVAGAWVFRDVNDKLAFVVANVGFSFCDQSTSGSTPLSSSCVDNISIFVYIWAFCSPRPSNNGHGI